MTQAIEEGNGPGGRWSDASRRWYADRGPDWPLDRMRTPALIEQGTVDTLFPLAEADHNYRALAARGVPVSMLWYCGGHGICLTDHDNPANDEDPQRAEVAWLNRWVKRDRTTDTGPDVTLVDQNGTRYGTTHYPVPTGRPLTATGHGTLPLVPLGGAGPLRTPPTGDTNPLDLQIAQFTPTEARNAVNIPVRSTRPAMIVGPPRIQLAYRGTVAPGTRQTRIFAQLIDTTSGHVVGNQITPIPVTLDGRPHVTETELETVSQSIAPDAPLTLQLVATTPAYVTPRLNGSVRFERIKVTLPTAQPGALRRLTG